MAKNLGDKLENKKIYTFEEVFESSQKYFNGDVMAARNWVNKYTLKDSKGNLYEKNPDEMHHRLTREIARIEQKYQNPMKEEYIYNLIKDFRYIVPQGGPMSGIGNDRQVVSLSNCFVIGDTNDSYGGIIKTDEEQVQLMKRRGGVGHDLSHLRPNQSPVQNSALTSTGAVAFMERYSNSTREVGQDGRRGALMLTLSSKHPDLEGFIDAKMETNKVTGANISVKIDNEFMESVKYNRENPSKDKKLYKQQFPLDSDNPQITKEINPNEIWDKIINNAWEYAEPGILFWDTVINESIPDNYAKKGKEIRENLNKKYENNLEKITKEDKEKLIKAKNLESYETVSTNPCGEIPLCPYDSCRLLAINLYSYVENPFTDKSRFNFDKFKEHAQYAQRIMDDIIDLEIDKIDKILDKVEKDPEDWDTKEREYKLWKKIRNKAEEGRRAGIGITGEGDMLAGLGFTYGSKKGNEFSEEVHKNLAIEVYRSSINLAKERGAFEIYDPEIEKDNPFIKRIKNEDPELGKEMEKYGRRNISLLTIAPTGTVSQMTQTTSGLEPAFLLTYKRRRKVNPNDKNVKIVDTDEKGDSWEEYNVFHHKFSDWLEINGYNPEEVKKYPQEKLQKIVKKSPYYKATSNDVDWISKVRMQGAIQKWVDHSISATVNLPEEISKEKVGDVYLEAWKSGCKGITVYREGSRAGVLIGNKEKKIKRPKSLEAEVLRFKNKDENWIAFIGLDEKDKTPYEIFTGKMDEDVLAVPKKVKKGKIVKTSNGGKHYDFHYTTSHGYEAVVPGISHQFNKEFWNYSKLISGLLRYKMPVNEAVELVSSLTDKEDNINTWKAGVERALRKYIPGGTKSKNLCPICEEDGKKTNLIYQEGCMACPECGHTLCG